MDGTHVGKVLFVATVYTHLAAFHLPFMKLLQGWGYEVHAAASPVEGRKDEVEALGVTCHDIRFSRSLTSTRNWSACRAMRRLLARERYDLIHVHTPVAAWLTRFAARRSVQGPLLYTAHGFHFFTGAPWTHWLFFYPLERLAARWTDGLIVMNSEDLAWAKRMGFVEGVNLFFVHGVGVDLTRHSVATGGREAVRAELGLRPQDLVVTCVAEFIPRKNHAQLLSAWPHVIREIPNAHLLLVGDGWLRASLELQATKNAIPNVCFLGFRRDVSAILQAADVVVLGSKHEGLARCIMEAMAAGKPVVATNVRGSRDLVEDGATGLLVEVGDVPGLARALIHLLRDEELRRRMGKAGQAKVRDYALDRVLDEMASIYRRYLPGMATARPASPDRSGGQGGAKLGTK
ncbi:TPA: glycosyltransferase family 1 protein [Candidatus Acetothermia bacterium]|nr:glycosyltransferase family 1 protein [Candidatus Acetothermia bacterium]